ncbi:Piwi domain-containing protein [Truncatella angustata]|uniref:Piwi domain-containing protein n=1 Tax=Truncatella angustata TaxID=152316 RepID=A0A9P8ZYA3_9PEZI|nr:Piwi domain-containing protein [Truncatella angustata]KAH6653826.1 Piwi domain-containing protein [Truncatella angustata]
MNFDGASDRKSPAGSSHQSSQRGSISGSQAGGSQRGAAPSSPARSRSGSNAGGSQPGSPPTSGTGPFHKGTGVDPAFDPMDPKSSRPQLSEAELIGKRVDLPAEAFRTPGSGSMFAKRPGYNTTGKPIQVQLNLFNVTNLPVGDIQQYDINVTPNPSDSRALVMKVWHSKAMQNWASSTGGMWLYDGHKLAWCNKSIPKGEARISVDLDKESGKTQVGRNGVFYVTIRATTVIRMQMLKAYLKQTVDWDTHILQCMNFLDHLMRQWPSERMVIIKRNFYSKDGIEQRIDEMIGVRKGIYSAFRLCENDTNSPSIGLSLNVDVANTAFWSGGQSIANIAQYLCASPATRKNDVPLAFGKLADFLRPKKELDRRGNTVFNQSDHFKLLRRLLRLKFHVTHRGKMENPRIYTVKRIIFEQKYGAQGADSFAVTFMRKDRETGKEEGPIRIYDHWIQKYGRLGYPDLPLIETEKNGVFPMEVCKLIDFQRYAYKLDPDQTSTMIKIAVNRPKQRKVEIKHGVEQLRWDHDPYFREYGVRVENTMCITKARLLKNPEVHFGGGAKINPGVAGRWDLRGKRFIEPNPKPLVSWGFIGCGTNDGHAVEKDALKAFAQSFVRIYRGHGGVIKNDPFVECYPYNVSYPDMCTRAHEEIGKFGKATPQIIFFITSTRNSLVYERIKKNMDCRICLVSQNMLADHVKKNNNQYCSNVAMKVNAKLGGATCRALPVGAQPQFFNGPTMILGMDVSHGSPGSGAPSKAALTMSIDKTATKYCGNVQTNGYRTEIVTGITMHFLFERLMRYWVRMNGCPPKHVYYFRDGVSEGEFAHVIDHEVKELKRIFRDASFDVPRFTVIIATKRHHIRFFPKPGDMTSGDKNENPLPGTLVERDATHPFHFDFYLASHVAIQGTARPVHYSVILDEAQVKPDKLQDMIYQQCYQYMRSTTPVSLHPAVYYAHLASQRAASHEDVAASNREMPSGKAGFPLGKASSTASGAKPPTEAPLLISMDHQSANRSSVQHLNTTMWYI